MKRHEEWSADILGDEYEERRFAQPDDYSGPVAVTVIRRMPTGGSDKGVLYVHGFSDYFFQSGMGVEFNSRGYAFYAVDLRKYGRSRLDGQKFFEVRSLDEYFADIDAALSQMAADGITEVTLLGHSTGGLTSALYMMHRRPAAVRLLVLNSPFLAWNLPWYERAAIPLLSFIGGFMPGLRVPQPKDTRYARSLRKGLEGRWEYRTEWKPDQMPDVDAGWVRAIERGQRELERGAGIEVPVLVLTSGASARRGDTMDVFHRADGVLDVRRIAKAAAALGDDVTVQSLNGGLHDLSLSSEPVRLKYYESIFSFFLRHGF